MGKFTGHPITDDSALGGSVIERSLRIDQGTADSDSGSNYSRTFASGNRKTFTISVWVKKCNTPGNIGDDIYTIISCGGGGTGSYAGNLRFNTSDQLIWSVNNPAPSTHADLTTNRKFRDPSAWYHIVFVADTTQGTASNRLKLYVNGVQETDFASTTYPSQNYDLYFNLNVQHRIGSNSIWSDLSRTYGNFNGYFAEFHFLDGTAYDPSYFGYTDSQTGLWRPKKYTSSNYGTNGFYLDFKDNTSTTTLGLDKSGQGNNFTPEDVSVSDCILDTPSNNFATWNVEDGEGRDNSGSFSKGGLKVQIANQGDNEESGATLAFSSGKWYWEEYMQSSTDNSGNVGVGVKSIKGVYANNGNHWRVRGNGGESDNNGSQTTVSGLSWTNGDIIGIAVDMDAGTWTVSKNGTFIGANIHTNVSGTVTPMMHNSNGSERHTFITNFGQDSSFAGTKTAQGNKDANGIGDFYYPVPSGYKALCSKNLPPNVPSIIRPQKHFDTLLYTATGNAMTVTGLEFKPDFIWQKRRDATSGSHFHYLFNSVVGGRYGLQSNTNGAEFDTSNASNIVFKDGGFDMAASSGGQGNAASGTYVAWCWKAGGAAVTNTDGTITSQVSANKKAGFSIVTYTGDGSSGKTVGHGLDATPVISIRKKRDASSDWFVHYTFVDGTMDFLKLNSTTGDANSSLSAFTSTTLPVDDNTNQYVSYCWHDVPDYSKFGSYKGNGNADGPFVFTGFRPAVIIFKNASTATNWEIYDTKRQPNNPTLRNLYPNSSSSEETSSVVEIDILSNGFKIKTSWSEINNNNDIHIYMAFAEQPVTTPFATFPNAR